MQIRTFFNKGVAAVQEGLDQLIFPVSLGDQDVADTAGRRRLDPAERQLLGLLCDVGQRNACRDNGPGPGVGQIMMYGPQAADLKA